MRVPVVAKEKRVYGTDGLCALLPTFARAVENGINQEAKPSDFDKS
jgi:hypothetical protein